MKTIALTLAALFVFSSSANAQSLRSFLKGCAWGTLAGAGVGVVSLAFTDKPGDSWGNVAKGASLGLYAGIGYGLYQMNKKPEGYQQPDYSEVSNEFLLGPKIVEGKVDGVQVSGVIYNF